MKRAKPVSAHLWHNNQHEQETNRHDFKSYWNYWVVCYHNIAQPLKTERYVAFSEGMGLFGYIFCDTRKAFPSGQMHTISLLVPGNLKIHFFYWNDSIPLCLPFEMSLNKVFLQSCSPLVFWKQIHNLVFPGKV